MSNSRDELTKDELAALIDSDLSSVEHAGSMLEMYLDDSDKDYLVLNQSNDLLYRLRRCLSTVSRLRKLYLVKGKKR